MHLENEKGYTRGCFQNLYDKWYIMFLIENLQCCRKVFQGLLVSFLTSYILLYIQILCGPLYTDHRTTLLRSLIYFFMIILMSNCRPLQAFAVQTRSQNIPEIVGFLIIHSILPKTATKLQIECKKILLFSSLFSSQSSSLLLLNAKSLKSFSVSYHQNRRQTSGSGLRIGFINCEYNRYEPKKANNFRIVEQNNALKSRLILVSRDEVLLTTFKITFH